MNAGYGREVLGLSAVLSTGPFCRLEVLLGLAAVLKYCWALLQAHAVSPFSSLGGCGDTFVSGADLSFHLRPSMYLEESALPVMVMQDRLGRPLSGNSYALEFFKVRKLARRHATVGQPGVSAIS
jgi:hypothetical protein